jgi:hypothetical protein
MGFINKLITGGHHLVPGKLTVRPWHFSGEDALLRMFLIIRVNKLIDFFHRVFWDFLGFSGILGTSPRENIQDAASPKSWKKPKQPW